MFLVGRVSKDDGIYMLFFLYFSCFSEPVRCGTKIRLEHIQTGRNLHSHLFSSPLSGHQEISAFGEEGKGKAYSPHV